MKILRSQYLQSQCKAKSQQNFADNRIKKVMPYKGKSIASVEHQLGVKMAPTQLLTKKDIVCFNANSTSPTTNIQILIENIDETLKKLNVVLEYVDMSPMWLTNVYKTYENDLWRKRSILDANGDKKWTYLCGLCTNVYKTFYSIKSHLNLHLNVYPYVCKICLKRYTGRKSATSHLKTTHHLGKEQWNDFLAN